MRLNEARDAERREFESMRNQFATMADRLGKQADLEAEKAARDKKNRFGSRTTGAIEADKTVYFDDFARKQESPKKDLMTINVDNRRREQFQPGFSRPGTGQGPCEWDRLMKEREELLQSGCYTVEDPLIKEIERQIQASQTRDNRIAAN